MPKNKGKGGKNRRKGKSDGMVKQELLFKEAGEEYAQVTKMLGGERVEAKCFDGEIRQCHICGKMRKRVWINQGDIILISLRDFQNDKADVIHKYNSNDVRKLKTYGELPDFIKINETNVDNEDEDNEMPYEFVIDDDLTL